MRSARPDVQRAAIEYSAPLYIVCEGTADSEFLERLLVQRGLSTNDFHIGEADGFGGFARHIDGVLGASSSANLRKLLLVADNNGDPPARLAQCQTLLNGRGLPKPGVASVYIDGAPIGAGIFLMPEAGHVGNLESLLLRAVLVAKPGAQECVEAFAGCINAPGQWTPSTRDKMKLNALIAGYCDEDPSAAVSHVWNKRGNPIPLASAAFTPLVEFVVGVHQA